MHKTIDPAILYFGTPVALISTVNEDGTSNVAPNSSIWWLGPNCMLGIDGTSQTTENLIRTRECVLNLASIDLVSSVDKLAKTTGRAQLPLHKKSLGYRYEANKFSCAALTEAPSEIVAAPRVKECQIQLEAKVQKIHTFGKDNPRMPLPCAALELSIERVHVQRDLLIHPDKDYIDPDKWHPLIMSFRKFYSTGPHIFPSTLSEGSEKQYAPWKQTGWKRKVAEMLLRRSARKYTVMLDRVSEGD